MKKEQLKEILRRLDILIELAIVRATEKSRMEIKKHQEIIRKIKELITYD